MTLPPSASGQVGIDSPDPVRRTIPPHTMSTNTSTTVAMKKPGRRLCLEGPAVVAIEAGGAEDAGITGCPEAAGAAFRQGAS